MAAAIDCLAENALNANVGWRRRTSSSDPLTGLQRCAWFPPSLVQALHSAGALVLFDVDGMIHLNDRFHHDERDAISRRIGRLLAELVPSPGNSYLIGGGEFAVLLPGSDRAAALTVAERIRGGIAALKLPEPGSDAATRHQRETSAVTARLAVACWGDGDQPDAAAVIGAANDVLRDYPRVPNRVSGAIGFL